MGMSLIVERAVCELKLLAENVPEGRHVVTTDIRKYDKETRNKLMSL